MIDDKITNDEDEILEELAKYYERLYREKHMISTFHLLEVESYKLTYSEKEYCDRDISIQELTDAIKSMKSNKSPGSDGLTSDLLTALWDDLKDLYIEMINQVFHNERLPE